MSRVGGGGGAGQSHILFGSQHKLGRRDTRTHWHGACYCFELFHGEMAIQ